MSQYTLLVHGGAGFLKQLTPEKKQQYEKSLAAILLAGQERLASGAAAIDVVEHCANLLEDDELYNAGKGSVLNADGIVEMDAAIMDGVDLSAGSVIGVQGVIHPTSLARLVKDTTEHVMLAGAGAQAFAVAQQVPMADNDFFVTSHRLEQWQTARQQGKVVLDHTDASTDKKFGTIGAVARDIHGTVAAATSTGGIVNKQFGRVGDSPVIGAGVWADNETCAVSATGFGEQFLRTVLAKTVADYILFEGCDAATAAEKAIGYLVRKVKGLGGIIVVDAAGNWGEAYSTDMMIRGVVTDSQAPQVSIE